MSHIDVKEACKRIAASLKARSGRRWSVTHGRGSDFGWITIQSPPSRRRGDVSLISEDRIALARLLGVTWNDVHFQGYQVSPESRAWVVARAKGPTDATGRLNAAYFTAEPEGVLS
jgi:hypothetical protein